MVHRECRHSGSGAAGNVSVELLYPFIGAWPGPAEQRLIADH